MKIVGLNITKGRVAATVIEKGYRQTELKGSFIRTFATDAELIAILKERAKDWSGARIISSIPGQFFSQRMAQFPFADRKHVEKALPFELEDTVPFDLDTVVIDHLLVDTAAANADKKNGVVVLGIMLPKTVLRTHLELLAAAGLDPQVIVPSYAGLYYVAKKIPVEGTAVLIDGNDLCVKDGKAIRGCRSFSGGSTATSGIRHIFKALEAEHGLQVGKVCLLSENDAVRAACAGLDITVEQIVPEFNGKKAADSVSLGLALSGEMNFRQGIFAYHAADEGARKRRRTLIAAGAVAAFLLFTNFGVKYYLTQTSYGRLDGELKELFRQAAPEARLVGDPVKLLRDKLEDAKKKLGVLGTGKSVLDVMKAVTEGIPKEVRVSFHEFLLEADRLKLQGEASSFEAVDKIKAELLKAPPFAEVQVLDTRMGVDNKVKFRFDIKLKQAM